MSAGKMTHEPLDEYSGKSTTAVGKGRDGLGLNTNTAHARIYLEVHSNPPVSLGSRSRQALDHLQRAHTGSKPYITK